MGGTAGSAIRFIPTYVGNATDKLKLFNINTVHPHVCGEREVLAMAGAYRSGSSPRMWGTPYKRTSREATIRFIPTYVGNAVPISGGKDSQAVHPHVCGERTWNVGRLDYSYGSSPRMWGTL